MDRKTVARLENVYEHVDDVDLFPGGMAEKPVVGGIVGPTFACILGQQFLNLRKGDRFWYENGDHPGAFTSRQLQQIRTSSLARVVCDCMDDVEKLQPFLFLQPDTLANIRAKCRGDGQYCQSQGPDPDYVQVNSRRLKNIFLGIPSPDLGVWKEDPNLRPQQFSSSSLLKHKSGFAGEVPESPMFPHIFDSEDGQDLKFVPKDTDGDLNDVLRQPPIGN